MRTLVAGLGNIFHGDDGVGVAAVQALAQHQFPDGVTVSDFGIRGVHLAYELLDGYDLVVIIDAVQRGGPPGTVHVIEHVADAAAGGGDVIMDGHDMAPDEVLALVPALGGTLGRVVVVGCEIAATDPCTELSPEIHAAVPALAREVVRVVESAHDNDTVTSGGQR